MRELKRSIMRAAALKQGIKPSKYINRCWHRYQQLRYGKALDWIQRLNNSIRNHKIKTHRKTVKKREQRRLAIKRQRRCA